MYVYIRTEKGLWTVGFYDPKGEWIPESDHENPENAAKRVQLLNSGATDDVPSIMHRILSIERRLDVFDERFPEIP